MDQFSEYFEQARVDKPTGPPGCFPTRRSGCRRCVPTESSTPPVESAFDDITRIASHVCQTPIALVSLVDEGRQWFKSEIGLGMRQTPLEQSICAHALLEHSFLEVPDTTRDPRFDCNPLVTGKPHLRFYAGALLRTPDGLPLGTVCVLDDKPRQLTPEQRDILAALARQVMSQMEFRRALLLSDRLQRNVSRLMAVAGHDLKQPLQVMVIAIDRVRSKLTDARDRERLAMAVDAGMRMAEELDRLAETSVLHTGLGAPQLRSFPVSDIFESIRHTWLLHAEAKGLRLVVKPCKAQIVSDPGMLRAIIGNLVGNAIKYTERGRVLLGCRKRGNSSRSRCSIPVRASPPLNSRRDLQCVSPDQPGERGPRSRAVDRAADRRSPRPRDRVEIGSGARLALHRAGTPCGRQRPGNLS